MQRGHSTDRSGKTVEKGSPLEITTSTGLFELFHRRLTLPQDPDAALAYLIKSAQLDQSQIALHIRLYRGSIQRQDPMPNSRPITKQISGQG